MWVLILMLSANVDKEKPAMAMTSISGFESAEACKRAGNDAVSAFRVKNEWNTEVVFARYSCAMLNKG